MLYITSNIDPNNKKYLDDVVSYFDFEFYRYVKPDKIVNKILEEIDGAHIISNDIVETKFGRTIITNLSTGCKALLIAAKKSGLIVNFTEAGNNVVELAVELSKDIDMHIYTRNRIAFHKNHNFIINHNGKEMTVGDLLGIAIAGRYK